MPADASAPDNPSPDNSSSGLDPNAAPTGPLILQVDIVSDVVCPWCVIGFKQLEAALNQLNGPQVQAGSKSAEQGGPEQSGPEQHALRLQAAVRWHPFELNPEMAPEGQNLREHVAEKYGTGPEESERSRAHLVELAASLGLPFRYDEESRIYNTFQAHQLLHWAGEEGLQTMFKMSLFETYFTRQEDVSDPAVLAAAAGRAGLDTGFATQILDDGRYADAVRKQQAYFTQQGIQGVPAMIIDRKYLLSGAQGIENYRQVLNRVLEEKAA
ncbi:MAG: DsbA family oxidoreductase [Pseudomonadota bacterium]